jgi:hypothetical protein
MTHVLTARTSRRFPDRAPAVFWRHLKDCNPIRIPAWSSNLTTKFRYKSAAALPLLLWRRGQGRGGRFVSKLLCRRTIMGILIPPSNFTLPPVGPPRRIIARSDRCGHRRGRVRPGRRLLVTIWQSDFWVKEINNSKTRSWKSS